MLLCYCWRRLTEPPVDPGRCESEEDKDDDVYYRPEVHPGRDERAIMRDPMLHDPEHPTRLNFDVHMRAAIADGAVEL